MSLLFRKRSFPNVSAAQTACVSTRPTGDAAPLMTCARLPTGVLPSDGRLPSARDNKKRPGRPQNGTAPAA